MIIGAFKYLLKIILYPFFRVYIPWEDQIRPLMKGEEGEREREEREN